MKAKLNFKLISSVLLVMALSGCVTMTNRIACTLSTDKAIIVIEAGIKIALDVEENDGSIACAGLVINQLNKGGK